MANKLVSYFLPKPSARTFGPSPVPAGFIAADGLKYETFLARIHQAYLFDWYMEIGCRTGTILALSRGKTLAIDPYFQVDTNVIGPKPALHLFQQTSDDFFASGFLKNNRIALSTSFLDGMHLIEFLLRDFINTERHSHPNGVIALHDCLPRDHAMTTRDLDAVSALCWTGDVWKMLPILQKFRPDLKVTVLNCSATGLVVVSGLDPTNEVLAENYDLIIRNYQALELQAFGTERFFSSFGVTDAQSYLDAGSPDFARIAIDPGNALVPKFITP